MTIRISVELSSLQAENTQSYFLWGWLSKGTTKRTQHEWFA